LSDTETPGSALEGRWLAEGAWAWYRRRPWLVGCNFTPSTASNQLEMWQADSFDVPTIERELGWAADLGFNVVRVFLHDLLWRPDPGPFLSRVKDFLEVATRQGIQTILVLFDGVWHNRSYVGPQPDPVPGVHNSRWLQSPSSPEVVDPASWPRLREYVQGVLSSLGDDDRILMWDLYNEPGNEGLLGNALPLLEQTFRWAREVGPNQPLTVGNWNRTPPFDALNRVQEANSDVITFHSYEDADSVARLIGQLRDLGRPLICTEYLARTTDSHFETHLPLFQAAGVGCINWGLVAGRTQTYYPWGSVPGAPEPETWYHDIFRADGTPYDPDEVAFIRETIRAGRTSLVDRA